MEIPYGMHIGYILLVWGVRASTSCSNCSNSDNSDNSDSSHNCNTPPVLLRSTVPTDVPHYIYIFAFVL